jgi:hypothetical protein
MKSIFPRRLVPASVLMLLCALFSVFFAPLAEAGRRTPDIEIEPNIRIGTSARSVGMAAGTNFSCFGEHGNFTAWYKALDAEGKRGCRILLTAVHKSSGKAPDTMRILRDLSRIESVLRPPHSAYTMDLAGLCKQIEKFDGIAKQLDGGVEGINVDRMRQMLVSMLSKTRGNGVSIPKYSFLKGGVPEILEINALPPNVLKEIQPRAVADARMFREALCEGGPINGKWYLEVKNYPKFQLDRAIRSLEGQVVSHLDRVKEPSISDVLVGVGSIEAAPGIFYRFAKAGENNENFEAYLSALKKKYQEELLKRANLDNKVPEEQARIKERISTYLETRLKIENVGSQ